MIKYRTTWHQIDAVDVAGETSTQIITQQGTRKAKRSSYVNWHDTWEDAHAFLVSNVEKVVVQCQNALADERQKLEQIKAMRKDEA